MRLLRFLLAVLALALVDAPASAGTRVYTNQEYLEDAMAPPDFDIRDMKAVFRAVFESLPPAVKVYPTENYYYFYFYYRGIKYAGNLRFDIADRDKGMVHFNYFKDFTLWQRDESDFSALYGAKDGIDIKPAGKLAYDMAFEGKHVIFQLNDLSAVKPPPGVIRPEETYIGPIFDDSGIRFFLVFNRGLKIFLFVLDETSPVPDQFNRTKSGRHLHIGIRTGYVFVDDKFVKRKILVAVNQANTSINNYLDGPFDQLPDNFIEGNVLQDAILAASPEMKGHMDRFGNSPDGETRYLIAPYYQYEDEGELSIIEKCADEEKLPVYYNCFSFVGMSGGK